MGVGERMGRRASALGEREFSRLVAREDSTAPSPPLVSGAMIRSLLAFLAFIAAVPAYAQPLTAAETAAIDKLVADTLSETGVPSASIALVRDGRIVLTKA